MRVRVALAAVLAISSAAAASPLSWQAPASCPAAQDVEARIEQRLGVPLDELDHAIAATVTRDGEVLVAHVDLVAPGDREARTLAAPSCDELVDAIAVIVTRLARVHARPAVAVIDPELPPPLHLVAPPPPLPPPPPRASPRWSLGAHLAALAGVGMLPSAGYGGEIAAHVARGPAIAELAYARWARSSGPSSAQVLGGVAVDFAATTARIGYRLGALPVAARAETELGWMRGTGLGSLGHQTGRVTWLAAGAGLAADWRATRWLRLIAAADAFVAIDRPRFELQNGAPVYEAGQLSARVSMGIEVGLP